MCIRHIYSDYLNAGHAALLLGNMEKAAELYGKATSESGNRETFLEMFDKDKEMLIKYGKRNLTSYCHSETCSGKLI